MMMRVARPIAWAWLLLLAGAPVMFGPAAHAQDQERGVQAPAPGPSRAAGPRAGLVPAGGTLGLVLTALLAIVGGGAVLGARFRPIGAAGELRVVGRAQLSGRHAVYLLRAGDRTLIVGVGPQGAPSLLGELEPAASTGLATLTPSPTTTTAPTSTPPAPHLDPARPGVGAGEGA